jgi:hypothetical protein
MTTQRKSAVRLYGGHSVCPVADAPGLTASQGGNIWFSDRTSAVKARDKQRSWQSMQYLQDVGLEYEPEF